MSVCKRKLIGLGISGVIALIVGCVLGFAVFPSVVEDTINENVWLAPGTPQYARFVQLPFPLSFKVYLFNITNLDEIRATGAKPVVEEIGPYIYDEYLEKKNIAFNYIKNTVEFEQHRLFFFNEEASSPYKESDLLNVVNVPMVAIQQMIVENLEMLGLHQMIPVIDEALQVIFANQVDPFMRATVKNYLWNGIQFCDQKRINDTSTDPVKNRWWLSTTICKIIKSMKVKNIEAIPGLYHKFSFMSYKNNTHDGRFVFQTGTKDVSDLGRILTWQGMGYTKIWNPKNETVCDKVHGLDSTIYPPHIDEKSEFDIYATDICRTSKLKYAGEMEYKGIKGLRYEVDENAFASPTAAPENECYCINQTLPLDSTPGCQPDGFVDMNNCQGARVLASFPHMLWGDETYYNSTIGQSKDISKHLNFVELEPNTGSPLRGTKMAQFNVVMRYIPEIGISTAMFEKNPSVIPMLWVDEGMELPDFLVDEIKGSLLNVLTALDIVTWVLIGLGIFLICISIGGYVYITRKENGSNGNSFQPKNN